MLFYVPLFLTIFPAFYAVYLLTRGVLAKKGALLVAIPKLLAGPILKYHEMRDQITKPWTVKWPDFGVGFLRFSRGIGRKLLIFDPLGIQPFIYFRF